MNEYPVPSVRIRLVYWLKDMRCRLIGHKMERHASNEELVYICSRCGETR